MFTGLVDDVGTIDRVSRTEAGIELRVACRYRDLAEGESVAVNGCCLTVRERGTDWFTTAAMHTTVSATTIADWGEGRRVNLERALRMGDRLGGHFVQGHVDGVAEVTRADVVQDAILLEVAVPDMIRDLMADKGSVALDGVSLTVSALPSPDKIQVSLIEYTRRHTTLGELTVGSRVHIEADMLARHVRRLLKGV